MSSIKETGTGLHPNPLSVLRGGGGGLEGEGVRVWDRVVGSESAR